MEEERFTSLLQEPVSTPLENLGNISNDTLPDSLQPVTSDLLSEIERGMKGEVPQLPSVDVPQKNVPAEKIISDANQKAKEPILDARIKLTNLYIECEQKRLEQQKPLLVSIVGLTKTLIWLFNGVIGFITVAVIILCFVKSDVSILERLFDFLKYYVGAVLVELTGMLLFVAKSVFSSNYRKILDNVLNVKSDKQ